jgi:serine phosphatase RsbU (regulator of sigma subunit)
MTDDLQLHVRRVAEQEAAQKQIDHELNLARDIQRGLLPHHPPRIDGYDIAGWSLPAQQTGGDYYDWQPLPDGRIVVSIADATGHGIGPALVTAVCRAYARASFPSGERVDKLLARINGLLADDLPSNRFVTFALAVVDSRTHSLQMLSAGHGPQLYYHAAEDRMESFEADGFPLAVVPVVEFEPASSLSMQPGDFLCMITDGFFEWQNRQDKIFGIQRLIEAIRRVANQPAAAIIDAAYAAVRTHAAGAPQQDDLTAVVIKRTKA